MSKKLPFWRTVKFKYILILALILVFMAGVVTYAWKTSNSQSQQIYDNSKEVQELNFESILNLERDSLLSITKENTYWDEMVDFIKKPSSTFEEEILKSQLEAYSATAAWTYNKNYNLVSTTTQSEEFGSLTLGLKPTDFKEMFNNGYLAHYYLPSPKGIMEVFGATVHPSNDVEHKTAPQGYFFIARILGDSYTSKLESLTYNKIKIVNSSNLNQNKTNYNPSDGLVAFTRDLMSYDKRLIGQIYVVHDASDIGRIVKSSKSVQVVSFMIYILMAMLVYVTLGIFIIRPLTLIHTALLTGRMSLLKDISNKPTEFGHIADLILAESEHKKEVEHTIKQKNIAQKALEERSEELEKINSLMINRELKMIELKNRLKASELKAGKKDGNEKS